MNSKFFFFDILLNHRQCLFGNGRMNVFPLLHLFCCRIILFPIRKRPNSYSVLTIYFSFNKNTISFPLLIHLIFHWSAANFHPNSESKQAVLAPFRLYNHFDLNNISKSHSTNHDLLLNEGGLIISTASSEHQAYRYQ